MDDNNNLEAHLFRYFINNDLVFVEKQNISFLPENVTKENMYYMKIMKILILIKKNYLRIKSMYCIDLVIVKIIMIFQI